MRSATPYSEQPQLRVSDADRQRVVEELRRHCAAGRLDVDEYADRIAQALGASSWEDLDRALGELPMLRIADPSSSMSSPGHRRDRRSDGPTGRGRGGRPVEEPRGWSARLASTLVVLLSVTVVLAAVILAAVVSWTWAAVLVAGWLLGLAQARVAARRR
jgi:hypothetical protein